MVNRPFFKQKFENFKEACEEMKDKLISRDDNISQLAELLYAVVLYDGLGMLNELYKTTNGTEEDILGYIGRIYLEGILDGYDRVWIGNDSYVITSVDTLLDLIESFTKKAAM